MPGEQIYILDKNETNDATFLINTNLFYVHEYFNNFQFNELCPDVQDVGWYKLDLY